MWSPSFVHQMFTIIFFSFVVVVCSVDGAQMSGMAFIKALSSPLLQRTGSVSSVNKLSFSSVVYSWMFVTINLISLHFSFPVIVIITFACFSLSFFDTWGGTIKNNGILKTLKSYSSQSLSVGARCNLIMKAVFNSILFTETYKKRICTAQCVQAVYCVDVVWYLLWLALRTVVCLQWLHQQPPALNKHYIYI